MASFHKDNISLSEALTMELPHITRVWRVAGCKVPDNEIPPNARVVNTFVSKIDGGSTTIGINYTIDGGIGIYMKGIAEFAQFNLEEIQKKFPNLFKLTGNLSAFGKE